MDLRRSFQDKLEKQLKDKKPRLQILIGPRQVGKSTAAAQIYDKWPFAKLMVSADSPTPPTAEWIEFHWQRAKALGPETLFIIDEIQKVVGWSEQIKLLFDADKNKSRLKVLLLGSSSLNIQNGLAESLAGRFELTFAPHWTYKECAQAFGWNFETYLKYGGYPGAAEYISDETRWRNYILNSIIEPVLGKDITSQARIDKPALFRQCFELCLGFPAQEISFTKLLGQLQDKGNATTIKSYIDLFDKVFLITGLQKYSGSKLRERGSSPKIIIHNTALIHAYESTNRLTTEPDWYGRVFESIVGFHLSLLPGSQLYYWRENNDEVDFVIKRPGEVVALEIKSGRRKTTTAGLISFRKKFPKARCEIWGYENCLDFMMGAKEL